MVDSAVDGYRESMPAKLKRERSSSMREKMTQNQSNDYRKGEKEQEIKVMSKVGSRGQNKL